MAEQNDEWLDDEAGRLVPLYALTGGRTRPAYTQLDLATLVMARRVDGDRAALEREYLQIVELCHGWLSVAEIAAHLKVPLVVAKVQLSDLIDRGAIVVSSPTRSSATPSKRDLLQQVLNGLRAM